MSDSTTNSGIGFTGLLAILFIGLKLGNVIDWSWWWVLSPLWIPVALLGTVFVVAVTLHLGYQVQVAYKNKKKRT